ncbi:TIGR03087 family PEP-CTERM/XrtA system glycosyltransferase [Pseudorhodoferax sp. Leaf267]|uniref:TIGR03087 family PEP-CTERM/XrtA system glycosyltransferase n=1 Tax=Pseudorhodoferax sp. Leaf267 TaxID=1736316 RepID=UPI000A63FEC0|nr:TIGR03087 family PEP-CTERM/XrtA system glycosyltransferase [Pseudorhodoferax sp. Leaf267]
MANLLYLVHRLPYPPNKGDKVRSYHLLRHLQREHRVFLGTFIDDPQDEAHLPALRAICPDLHVARLQPRTAKLRSLGALLRHEALTLAYYRDAGLERWVRDTLAAQPMDASVVFSSAMAQYAPRHLPMLVDFVDLDSAKWSQYAASRPWPLSWLYRREGARLLAFERSVAARAQHSFFVTPQEALLFQQRAVESAARVESLGNGVDAAYFAADPARVSPYAQGEQPLVFTGAMDYWPNVDAVVWFCAEVLPPLRQRWPRLRFVIVGRNPAPAVQALASDAVSVTGTVPDVRPYLQHAALVVAPLRIARGIQNKILEAMAMGKAVVATAECAQAIGARDGIEMFPAADAADFVAQVDALLQAPQRAAAAGRAARDKVLRSFSWEAHLSGIDRHLNAFAAATPQPVPAC